MKRSKLTPRQKLLVALLPLFLFFGVAAECRDQGNPISTAVCSTQPNGGSTPLCH